jgi:hypothetical protein
MVRQNPHFTGSSRQNDNVHIALKNSAILGNDFTTNGHGSHPVIASLNEVSGEAISKFDIKTEIASSWHLMPLLATT